MRGIVPRTWHIFPVWLRRAILWLTHPTRTVGVSAVLLNEAGEFLLLRHRYRERLGWELPGGLVGRGEQLEDALHRELLEETGLTIEIVGIIAAKIGPPQHIDVCYVARVVGGALVLDVREVVAGHYFPHDALPSLLTPAQMSTIALAMERYRPT